MHNSCLYSTGLEFGSLLSLKVSCLIWSPILNGHVYLSGARLGVDYEGTSERHALKNIKLRAQNLLSILSSVVNVVWGRLYDLFIRNNIFTLTKNKIFI